LKLVRGEPTDERADRQRMLLEDFLHRGVDGFLLQTPGVALVGDGELGVNSRKNSVLLEQARTKSVNGRDPRALEFTAPSHVVVEGFGEFLAKVAGSLLGEGDGED